MDVKVLDVPALMKLQKAGVPKKDQPLARIVDQNQTTLLRISNQLAESAQLVSTLLTVLTARKVLERVNALTSLQECLSASGPDSLTVEGVDTRYLAALLIKQQTVITGLIRELLTTNQETSIVFVPPATPNGTD